MVGRCALSLSLFVAASALAHGFDSQCHNPSWRTVDDFVLPGTADASASAIAIARGTVYVAGISGNSSSGHWLVRQSHLFGGFSTSDDFLYSLGLLTRPRGAVAIGRDAIIVGGANNLSNAGPWLARHTDDRGQSWATTDEFTDPTQSAALANAAALGRNGAIYVAGYSNLSDGYHWFIRESIDQGASFTTVDDVAPIRFAASAKAIAVDRSGDLYVAGYNFDGVQYRWQVRRRHTGVWSTVDDYVPSPAAVGATYGAQPFAIAAGERAGHVVVVGTAVKADGLAHWIVRRTLDGGQSWVTVDDIANCGARGAAFVRRGAGEFVVTGRCTTGGFTSWVTRSADDRAQAWRTDDSYQLPGGDAASGFAVAVRGSRVFVVGSAGQANHGHWVVRERNCHRSCSHHDDDADDDDDDDDHHGRH